MISPRKRLPWINENGFSLIDVVVTVAIIVALSVGGFVSYNGLIDNAKRAAVVAAADQVYTAATVAESDGNSATNNLSIEDNYNKSNSDLKVVVTGSGETLAVAAYNVATPSIRAFRNSDVNATPPPILGSATVARTNLIANPNARIGGSSFFAQSVSGYGVTTALTGAEDGPNGETTARLSIVLSNSSAQQFRLRFGGSGTQHALPSPVQSVPVAVSFDVKVHPKLVGATRVEFPATDSAGASSFSNFISFNATGEWQTVEAMIMVTPKQAMVDVVSLGTPQLVSANSGTPGLQVRDTAFLLTNMVVELADKNQPYFDGSSPDRVIDGVTYSHSWTGAPNSSSSIATYLPEL